jgi:hypothetical protein
MSEWNGIMAEVKTPGDVDLPRAALQPASLQVETIAGNEEQAVTAYLYSSHH